METRATRSVIASSAGLERLKEKRRRSGKSADVIAGLAGVSRSLVQKFFKGESVSVDNFRSLCTVLELDWEDIVEPEKTASSATNRKRVAFVIEGSLDDLDPTKLAKLQAMVRALQQLTGDASITTVRIEDGSIRLILEGSEEGIENLKQLFDEGELTEVLGTPIRAVEPIESDTLNTGEVREDRLKALLILTIQSQDASGADLRGADLRGADLRGADLRGADLRGADLSNSVALGRDHDRALALALDLDRNHDLARDLRLGLASALTRDLGRNLGRALDLTLTLDRDRDRDRARDLARDLARALAGASADDLARALALARALDRDLAGTGTHDLLDERHLAFALAREVALALARALDRDLAGNPNLGRARTLARDLASALASNPTNFSDANFSGANFSGANFSGANFSGANFSGAIVENAQFGKGIGINEFEKRDLKRRGAIFNESAGDREFSLR